MIGPTVQLCRVGDVGGCQCCGWPPKDAGGSRDYNAQLIQMQFDIMLVRVCIDCAVVMQQRVKDVLQGSVLRGVSR